MPGEASAPPSAGATTHIPAGGGSWNEITPPAPSSSAPPDWGTYIPPEVAANSDGIIGILGKAEMQSPEYQEALPPPTA
jgi:hypothetical protein